VTTSPGSPPTRSRAPGGGPVTWVLAVVAVVAALVIAGGLGIWWVTRGGGRSDALPAATSGGQPGSAAPSASGPAPAVTVTVPASTHAIPTPAPDEQAPALQQLGDLRRQGLSTASFNGQWAAQLASKVPGLTDPLQIAQNGTHRFQATDILAEFETLRDGTTDGTDVILLSSTDYGSRHTYHGKALWVTFALGQFSGAEDVRIWCANRFPSLSGKALENQCTPRQLNPAN